VSVIPPSVRNKQWYTRRYRKTDNFDEAHFILEAGEWVRIVKLGSFYDSVHELTKNGQ